MTPTPTTDTARIDRKRIQSKLARYRRACKLLHPLPYVQLPEEGFEHRTRDRGGRRPPVTAVLHEDGPGDARIVLRSETDEPGVVPLLLGELVRIDIARGLEDLGGPGLCADVPAGDLGPHTRAVLVYDTPHGVPDHLERAGVERHPPHHVVLVLFLLDPLPHLDRAPELRPVDLTAV